MSLQKHAVPLDERTLAALAHSSTALYIYAWFAQRLHRIPHRKLQFVPWAAVKGQFGIDFGRMNKFKQKFRIALSRVLRCYPKAKIEVDDKGLTLRHSPPPISASARGESKAQVAERLEGMSKGGWSDLKYVLSETPLK